LRFGDFFIMQFRTLLLASAALAVPAIAQAQAVDGLYIGGAAGYNHAVRRGVEARQGNAYYFDSIRTGRDATIRLEDGFVGLANVGYGFGNGLRVELEGNYRQNDIHKIGGFSGRGLSGAGVTPAFGATSGTQTQYGAMANVYYDFDLYRFGLLGYALTPYVGVGAGYMITSYDDVRATRGVANGNTVRIDGDSGRFAYQGIVGISAPIEAVPGLSITAEYRYAGSLKPDISGDVVNPAGGLVSTGKYRFSEQNNHSGLIGVRYAFNAARPPAPAPVPVAAPQRDAARTYLVFFDWDRADLTDRARQIIAEAAQATTRVQVTRIEVAGHTDSSGTPRYNQGLSVRRAQNVAAELVRLGVPQSSITTQGFGESRPLVQTADGVREPQNRRVEIILR
jgi:outer membrane protein OmpA-like peptidoglycan-associated protein